MMALLSSRLVVAAVKARLDGTTGVACYLSAGPTPPVGKTCVVYPAPGSPDGVLGDPDRNLEIEFQTTCVGLSAEQALWTHDQVVARVNRQSLTGTGFATYPIRMIDGTQQPVRRDDTLGPPWFYITCSWVATAQPA